MKFSLLDYVFLFGTVAVDAGLFFVIEYPFLRSLKIFFGVTALIDVLFFSVWNQPSFAYIQWYTFIALLIFQSFIAADLVILVCPRLPRKIKGMIPAVIMLLTIVNGKPGTTWGSEYPSHHMLIYELFCLTFLILVLCFSIILSSVPRYDTVVMGFGFLLAAQSVAAFHRLYVGISPFIWNLCWLAGIGFIVHAIFTYEPLDTFPLGKLPKAGQK